MRIRSTGMDDRTLLERITIDPKTCNGKPIIRGHQLTVERVLGLMAEGASLEDVLEAYPTVDRKDVLACLEYARRLVACMRLEGADLPTS